MVNTTDPETGRVGYTTWRRAQKLCASGYAVPAKGALQPGCLLILTHPEPKPSLPLPPGPDLPGQASDATTSHGDALGGTTYSSDAATATNPQGVWYLKRLGARDAWLFRLSVLDNLQFVGV